VTPDLFIICCTGRFVGSTYWKPVLAEGFSDHNPVSIRKFTLARQMVRKGSIHSLCGGILRSASQRGAKSLELRGALQAARFAAGGPHEAETLDGLREIYNRFDEGFDTPDLIETAELLESNGPAG
jgi:hypothetical protein